MFLTLREIHDDEAVFKKIFRRLKILESGICFHTLLK